MEANWKAKCIRLTRRIRSINNINDAGWVEETPWGHTYRLFLIWLAGCLWVTNLFSLLLAELNHPRSCSLTHSALTLSRIHSVTHSLTHCTHSVHSLTAPHSLIHSLTYWITHSLSHSLSHLFTQSLTLSLSLSLSHSLHSLIHSLTASHSLIHSLTHWITHSLTH